MTQADKLKNVVLPIILLYGIYSCNEQPPYQHYKDPLTSTEKYLFKNGLEVFEYKDEREFKEALQSYIDDSGSIYMKGRDHNGIVWNQISNKIKHYRVNITDLTSTRSGELRVYHNVYSNNSNSQNGASDSVVKPILEKKYTGWAKYTIENVGTIIIPPNMIEADNSYKELSLDYASTAYPSVTKPNTISFKQKAPMSETYAQVTINTFIKKTGAYLKMNSWTITPAELQQVNAQFKKANEGDYRGTDKLITWNGTTVETVGGCKALKTSYVRQVGTNPYVYVEMYTFHNNDRMHQLILSYRQKDGKVWKPLYSQILSSFKITNIR